MRDRAHRSGVYRQPTRREYRRAETMLDWFGPELGRNEILARQPPAQAVGEIVDRALSRFKPAIPPALLMVQDAWTTLVGVDAARRSRPVALFNRRLLVEVTDSAWLYMLQQAHRPLILAKLREFTKDAITDLRFQAAGGRTPERPANPSAPNGRRPNPFFRKTPPGTT